VLEENGYHWEPYQDDSADDDKSDSDDEGWVNEEHWMDKGDWVQDEEDDFTRANGNLSDHRPLNLNIDDYSRCAAVPNKKNANFRDYPGVVTHPDGGLTNCTSTHTSAQGGNE